MSNNKQSSIQWIVGKLGDLESMFNLGIVDNIQYYEEKTKLLDQAKAMHKEEMIDFGNDLLAQNDTNYIGIPNLAEQYYQQTYGDDKP